MGAAEPRSRWPFQRRPKPVFHSLALAPLVISFLGMVCEDLKGAFDLQINSKECGTSGRDLLLLFKTGISGHIWFRLFWTPGHWLTGCPPLHIPAPSPQAQSKLFWGQGGHFSCLEEPDHQPWECSFPSLCCLGAKRHRWPPEASSAPSIHPFPHLSPPSLPPPRSCAAKERLIAKPGLE